MTEAEMKIARQKIIAILEPVLAIKNRFCPLDEWHTEIRLYDDETVFLKISGDFEYEHIFGGES